MAADEGKIAAHQTLVTAAIGILKKGKLPPADLLEYFLEAVEEPDVFAKKMQEPANPSKSGKPSLDDTALRVDMGLDDTFFGLKPTEKIAMMVAYLVSIGHPINEAGNSEYESAAVVLSELTGRNSRSIQRDYYKHKAKLTGTQIQLALGESYVNKERLLANLRNPDEGSST